MWLQQTDSHSGRQEAGLKAAPPPGQGEGRGAARCIVAQPPHQVGCCPAKQSRQHRHCGEC